MEIPSNHANLHLQSESVQELLGKIPHWLIRWGMTVLFGFVVTMLIGAWFIHYPDSIPAKIKITTEQPPIPVIARAAGQIRFLVHNDQWVNQGEQVGIIQNSANEEDIESLKGWMSTLEDMVNRLDVTEVLPLNENPKLGALQAPYSAFLQRYNDFKYFSSTSYFPLRISDLKRQIDIHISNRSDLSNQRASLQRELALVRSKHNTNRQLVRVGALPRIQLQDSEAAVLQAERAVTSLDNQVASYDLQTNSFRQNLLDLENQYHEQAKTYQSNLRDSFRLLKGALEDWELNFVLKAPVSGVVSLYQLRRDNQFASAGEEVMTLLPRRGQDSKIVGRGLLSSVGAGKVKEGQQVRINLDGYPMHEFGSLQGTVVSIAPLAKQPNPQEPSNFLITISVPQNLVTSFKKPVQFRNEMPATAEIITEDLNLLERIFYQIRKIILKSN